MKPLLLAAFGGALGSAARYAISAVSLKHFADTRFPVGTFVVNVLGCLLAGIIAGLAERQALLSPEARVFLLTGVAGGFTTFSAFSLETVLLLRRGETLVAGSYIALSVACGLLALWLGFKVIK